MIDTDKYEGLIDAEGYIDYDGLDHLLAEVKQLREKLNEYEKYSICHPDGTHCCDECLERNGFEVKK